jgi:hypothetical protein
MTTTGGTTAEFVARQAQARWVRTRDVGRSAFIWRYGVVGWGLPVGAVSAFYHAARVHGTDPAAAWTAASVRPLWGSAAGLIGVCGVVGYLLGAWLWDVCEARFGQEPQ